MNVREHHRIASKGVYIGIGFDTEGHRTILSLDVKDGESENNWHEVFQSLTARGLSGVKLVISDTHKGLVKAIQKNFLGASWQQCQAHFLRNIFDKFPKKNASDVKDECKSIFKASELELTRERKAHFLEKYGSDPKLQAACDILEGGFEDAIQVLSLPENIRGRLRTTNVLERLNEEIRRRERVIRIFPNEDSLLQVIGSLLREKDTEWLSSPRKYLELTHRIFKPPEPVKGSFFSSLVSRVTTLLFLTPTRKKGHSK